MPKQGKQTALVLTAGGVRGAYQVGVLAGIVDVLGLRGKAGPPLFDVFAGTSVGALNAAFMAANADRADHAIDRLAEVWSHLRLRETLHVSPLSLWGWPHLRLPGRHGRLAARHSRYVGRALFDCSRVEALIERVVAWDRLHQHVDASLVRAVVIAALDVCDGRTTLFAELAPGVELRPCHTKRRTLLTPINAARVMASAALPFVYPARNIDGRYYMDGALRFGTPIGPALRAGADRVVAISLLDRPDNPHPDSAPDYPGFIYLLGKVLAALLLDPASHDLDNLQRINRMFEVIDETLGAADEKQVKAALEAEGELPYREVPTLVFRPSKDLGVLTAEFIREDLVGAPIDPLRRALIRWISRSSLGRQTELASILLLDGSLARRLIDLGRADAHAASDRIEAFFA
ncbi:patatin-like phospholipase family protein [Nannocystis sp. SCPEA4]|uniref:patatin-like phospholipase family protein n=1 Tax=Nannocystis sp. SCPEA4 TaxID=2996787 RepID=UPI00226DA263|nr:patatin-like phospholipase family protein [Nannocystis sp. SCPEA4]MCY1059527.1 patatin-like phospholipase family protein [Nannocystis sp. SCPEA4]